MSPQPLHIRSHAHGILEHNGTPLHSPPAGPASPAAPINSYLNKEHDRPSQLAQMLSASYAESDALRQQLRLTQRALERTERMAATLSSPSTDAYHKALLEEQARADLAERERDAALEKIRVMQDAWQDVVRYMSGSLGEGSSSQSHRATLMSNRFMDVSPALAPRVLNGTHGAFARVTLPTPPQVHRRAREHSPDGAYTNGASPAKRPRADRADNGLVQPPVWTTETTTRGRHPTLPSSFDAPTESAHIRNLSHATTEISGPSSVATRPRRPRKRSASRASSSSSMSLDKMLLEATGTGEELRGPNALLAQQYQSPSALANMAMSGPGVPRPLGGPGQTPSYASLAGQSQVASSTTYAPSAQLSVSGQSTYGNGIHQMSLNGHDRMLLPQLGADRSSSRHHSPALNTTRRPSPLDTREHKVEAQPLPFPVVGPAPQEPMTVSPPTHHAYVQPPVSQSHGGGFKSRGMSSRSHAAVPVTVTGPGLAGSLPPPPVLLNNTNPPLAQPQPQREYTNHIFTPPVTGAPVKRHKSLLYGAPLPPISGNPASPAPSTTSHVSGAPTLIPQAPSPQPTTAPPSVSGRETGPSNTGLGPGGFPPTNAAGQRICRQCGHPGRYKDGKCVEKWGPGPEGPGTVCDRCRKKMKRVERRGTEPGGLLGAGGGAGSTAGSASGSRAASPHRPAGGAGKSQLGRSSDGSNPYPDARRDSRSPDTRTSLEDAQLDDGEHENDVDIEGDLDALGSPDSALSARRVSPTAGVYGSGLDRDSRTLHAPSARTSRKPSPARPPIAVLKLNGQAGVDVEMEDYRDVSPTRLLEAAIDGDVPPPPTTASSGPANEEIEDDLLEAIDAAERRSHGGRRSMGEDDD